MQKPHLLVKLAPDVPRSNTQQTFPETESMPRISMVRRKRRKESLKSPSLKSPSLATAAPVGRPALYNIVARQCAHGTIRANTLSLALVLSWAISAIAKGLVLRRARLLEVKVLSIQMNIADSAGAVPWGFFFFRARGYVDDLPTGPEKSAYSNATTPGGGVLSSADCMTLPPNAAMLLLGPCPPSLSLSPNPS